MPEVVATTNTEVMTMVLPMVIPNRDGNNTGILIQRNFKNPRVAVEVKMPSEILMYLLSPANLKDRIPN